MGKAGPGLCSGVLSSTTTVDQLRSRLTALTCQELIDGPSFWRLMEKGQYPGEDGWGRVEVWAFSVDMVAWCSA